MHKKQKLCYKGKENPNWRGGKFLICPVCNKKFWVIPSHLNKRRCCSISCLTKFQTKEKVNLICEVRGKTFQCRKNTFEKYGRRFCGKDCLEKWREKGMRGENNPAWKGGIYPIEKAIRNSAMNDTWKDLVFHRDNFTCQDCGDKKGHNLNAHHLKPFTKIFKENNIKSLSDALKCGELWDIDNGLTLCENCHRKRHLKFNPGMYQRWVSPKKGEYIYLLRY